MNVFPELVDGRASPSSVKMDMFIVMVMSDVHLILFSVLAYCVLGMSVIKPVDRCPKNKKPLLGFAFYTFIILLFLCALNPQGSACHRRQFLPNIQTPSACIFGPSISFKTYCKCLPKCVNL